MTTFFASTTALLYVLGAYISLDSIYGLQSC